MAIGPSTNSDILLGCNAPALVPLGGRSFGWPRRKAALPCTTEALVPNVSPPPASPKASKAEGHHHTVKASRRGGRQGAPPASPVVKSPRFRLGLGVMPARTPPTGVLRGFNGRFGGILCQRAPR